MKNKQTFFLIILLFSFLLSCNENDSELFIEIVDTNHIQNRNLDCECEATITNLNDFPIITELYSFALGECPNGLNSQPENCNGCTVVPTGSVLFPGGSQSGTFNISNMFGDELNSFVTFVEPINSEEQCPKIFVEIDCGGTKTISQAYTIPASHLLLDVERYITIAKFINEQTDPDWNGLPWTGTWEESCSLTPTLEWWNFPCENTEDEQLVTPCWPRGI